MGENKDKKLFFLTIITVFMLLFSGCWDRTEVNDIGLITASAYDVAPDGGIQYSVQILVPSAGGQGGGQGGSGGQQKKNFIVETAIGMDPGDAENNIQKKFPRRLFRGHRRVIILGEELATQGLDKMLDSIGRDPQNRLRTSVVVAKGKKGIDLLQAEYPLERIPTEAMREMMIIGVGVNATIHDLLIAASSEGAQPIAVAIEKGEGEQSFKPTGIAAFKDLKLAGYLDSEDTEGYLWIKGKFKNGIIATTVPENEGVIRINVNNQSSKITPGMRGNKAYVNVLIKGDGSIYGNSTRLDLTVPENIELAQTAIKARIKKQVENTIKSAQKQVGADIFGFGSAFYQFRPSDWKKIKDKWPQTFPDLKVNVITEFKIKTSGMSGPPLYLKENEVKKK
ncbi:MAG: Ger(x)C family spore germination protein [Eubacterium sp.]|jgi:spore germination protein KC|nr:Ger(x)C family spore germination protein [Eubacterium sp.]